MSKVVTSDQLKRYRLILSKFLVEYLSAKKDTYYQYYWAPDIFTRLQTYTTSGKLLRGSLVLMSYELFGGKDLETQLPVAAALELTHSGLLIHDDIIDQDLKRRGQAAMHIQYAQAAAKQQYSQPDHQGQSLALCVGDITFFLSFELLSRMKTTDDIYRKISSLFAQEFVQVGLAETQDIHQGLTHELITEDDVFRMYQYKTGRYTFSLPLVAGAILAETTPETQQHLDALGETLGLIFQIKDDELGLFGDEVETGKAAVSDVREGKKTLYYLYTLELSTLTQREQLKKIFGNAGITKKELEYVQKVVIKSGAKTKVDTKITELEQLALHEIEELSVSEPAAKILQELVSTLTRRRV